MRPQKAGVSAPDHQRITPLGKLLRKYSIDELPQLLNVLIGNMSLVGPRPLYLSYVPLYNERQKTRLNMLPGITGLAQIHGRNATTWPQRLEWDAVYVEQHSFLLDMKVLWHTIGLVCSARGNNTLMEPFTGNND